MGFITKFRSLDGSEVDIEIALREAVTNAVIHGNCEDSSKRVHVTCRYAADAGVSIIVRDEGRGFDSRTVTNPDSSDNSFFTHGHGIQLMRWFMDEVRFEEGGTVVHMCKKSNGRRQ